MPGLDASNVQNEGDVQGRQPPVNGVYHGVVNHVDASFDKYDAVIADLEVLAGKPDDDGAGDQRGRQLRHMMFLDDEGNYGDKHLRFALATGLIKPGEARDVDWNTAQGRQLVFGVEKRAGKSKKDGEEREYTNVSNFGLDLWSVGNPEVASVPKDEAALKMMAGGSAPAPAAASSSDDPYAGI